MLLSLSHPRAFLSISFSPFYLLYLLRCSLLFPFPLLFLFLFLLLLLLLLRPLLFVFSLIFLYQLCIPFLFLTKKSHEDLTPPPKQPSWSDPSSIGSRRHPLNNNLPRSCKANHLGRQAPTTTPAKRGTRTTNRAATATATP